MSELKKIDILDALRNVTDPGTKQDIVSANMIKNIEINDSTVTIEIDFPPSTSSYQNKIKEDCIVEIKKAAPDITNIDIRNKSAAPAANTAANPLMPGVKNTIAVASGKGGVGKSTVSVNLAVALAKEGAKVGLIDADVYGPSIPLMLGIDKNPRIYQDPQTGKMLPLESYGIKTISIGFLIDEDSPVIWRGPMASGAIKQFMTDVNWGELDYLIFDLPPGTGDIQLTLVQSIPLSGAVIVTTPQDISLVDVKKAIRMFQKVNVPVLGIVENMSYFIAPDTGKKYELFGSGGGEKLSKEFSTQLLGKIPINPDIRVGGDYGKPIVISNPDADEAKIIREIARNLSKQVEANSQNSIPKIVLGN
ncbi:iron-sulfur cluster carrier protein ApbC [Melioribacter sp. Ez-97]|uniref:iron-sulfur cluster carrier protein ApbC n=1 Tax=Melioribacter sp. Ez-97 TaxID=3423434 RepID=UPI003EDA139E